MSMLRDFPMSQALKDYFVAQMKREIALGEIDERLRESLIESGVLIRVPAPEGGGDE